MDANVLFSAAYREDSGLNRLWSLRDVELITSAYAAEEARANLPERAQAARLERILRDVQIVPESQARTFPPGIELPEKDRPILLAAIAAKATHLLTGDLRDFGRTFGRAVGGVTVLPPGGYLRAARK